MANDEPDSALIDAWLAGELSPQEAADLERSLGDDPEDVAADAEVHSDESRGQVDDDESVFEDLDAERVSDERVLHELMARITQTAVHEEASRIPSPDAWREVLEPSDSDDRDVIGRLGHYEVLEVIAVGGMGIVFKARDCELDRLAALKVLAPDLAANATARERFLREARAAAKLEHENILSIYGVVEAGIPWFAMRYATGGTLQDRLDEGEVITFDQLTSVARQAATALEAAHQQGLVHRDIKPANLLFDEDGDHLWVCDFGIARSADDPSLTYPGAIAGTPKFMSPEQAAGKPLDGRSDLFSLGAVLYRSAMGEHAFAGETTASVLHELRGNEPLKVDAGNKALPRWFARLLNSLLARDPADRPENAAAIVRAIDEKHAPRPRHLVRRSRRIAVGLASAVGVLVVFTGAMQLPMVERSVNRMLGARFDHPVYIADRYGAYPDLRHAISVARDGDTIELPGDVPLNVDSLVIRPGKALSMVAADPAKRPRLTTARAGAIGLVSQSPLHFEGIDFLVNAEAGGDAILVINGTSASLDDCKFRTVSPTPMVDDDSPYRALELRGKAEVELSGCDLQLPNASAIAVVGHEAEIRIRDTRTGARYGVDVAVGDPEINQLQLDLRGQKFSGHNFLRIGTVVKFPVVTATATDCDFVCDRPLCWFRSPDMPTILSRTKWSGSGNTYPLGNAMVQVGQGPVIAGSSRLIAIEMLGESTSSDELPKIVIEGTGKSFSDINHAVKNAPAGATLLLSGLIECTEDETLVRKGTPLHFRANPESDSRPTLVAMGRGNHALFLIGPVTFSGIHFVRYDTTRPDPLPVLGVIGGSSAEVLFEDCEFSVMPGGANSAIGSVARCLSITNAGSATIRRCVFRGGTGIFAAFVGGATDIPLSLQVEDCVFLGASAIRVEPQISPANFHVSFSRCVVVGQRFLSMQGGWQMNRNQIAAKDCVIDLDGPLLHYSDRAFDELKGMLTWAGENNYYRQGARQFSNLRVRTAAGDFSHAADMTLEQLVAELPGSSETGASFGEPFDRSQIFAPVMPRDLLKAYRGSGDVPAVATMEMLAE